MHGSVCADAMSIAVQHVQRGCAVDIPTDGRYPSDRQNVTSYWSRRVCSEISSITRGDSSPPSPARLLHALRRYTPTLRYMRRSRRASSKIGTSLLHAAWSQKSPCVRVSACARVYLSSVSSLPRGGGVRKRFRHRNDTSGCNSNSIRKRDTSSGVVLQDKKRGVHVDIAWMYSSGLCCILCFQCA